MASAAERKIAVEYEFSPVLVDILRRLKASIVLSTYQAGKVLVLGTHAGQLTISYLDFNRPMGIAVGRDRLAIGDSSAIHFLAARHGAAPTVSPAGAYDGCFVAHSSRHTGRILGHDLAWGREGLWIVNTLFSCLCTLDDEHSFVPRWKPDFISALADEDRCHLNGLAMESGEPRYVTALAQSDRAAGWRDDKARSGVLIDVQSQKVVTSGLCMPHSPRVHNGDLYLLNSGEGSLCQVDRFTGQLTTIETMPGYTRGLAFLGQFAFVGMSRIRETNVFGGLPISERRDSLRCGIAVVDLARGQAVAKFEFRTGVEEIFAVDIIPGYCNLAISGAQQGEQQQEIWVVPPLHESLRNIASP